VLPGARTVIALALPYRGDPEPSPVARYARGRDYHYAHRDGMKALRKRLLALDATLRTYACVDTGVAMEKV
jgi:epoxyqueuosine reductase